MGLVGGGEEEDEGEGRQRRRGGRLYDLFLFFFICGCCVGVSCGGYCNGSWEEREEE